MRVAETMSSPFYLDFGSTSKCPVSSKRDGKDMMRFSLLDMNAVMRDLGDEWTIVTGLYNWINTSSAKNDVDFGQILSG